VALNGRGAALISVTSRTISSARTYLALAIFISCLSQLKSKQIRLTTLLTATRTQALS
jgi:hypothetical protein